MSHPTPEDFMDSTDDTITPPAAIPTPYRTLNQIPIPHVQLLRRMVETAHPRDGSELLRFARILQVLGGSVDPMSGALAMPTIVAPDGMKDPRCTISDLTVAEVSLLRTLVSGSIDDYCDDVACWLENPSGLLLRADLIRCLGGDIDANGTFSWASLDSVPADPAPTAALDDTPPQA